MKMLDISTVCCITVCEAPCFIFDIWSVAFWECPSQEYGGKVAILNGSTVTFVTLVTAWITAWPRPCEQADSHNCCHFVTTSNCGLKVFKDFDAILVFQLPTVEFFNFILWRMFCDHDWNIFMRSNPWFAFAYSFLPHRGRKMCLPILPHFNHDY